MIKKSRKLVMHKILGEHEWEMRTVAGGVAKVCRICGKRARVRARVGGWGTTNRGIGRAWIPSVFVDTGTTAGAIFTDAETTAGIVNVDSLATTSTSSASTVNNWTALGENAAT